MKRQKQQMDALCDENKQCQQAISEGEAALSDCQKALFACQVISRIEKLALPVQMPEESIRSKLAQQENEGMIKKLLAGEA